MIKIKKGLNLPITGEPNQVIENASTKQVAIVGEDYVGMKPTMHVKVGDRVKVGQLLFVDKKNPGVRFTSPACGQVVAINRGEKRVLQSVVVSVDGTDAETFKSYQDGQLLTLSRDEVEDNLNQAGLWVAFKTRPFSKAPALGSKPHSIFVTAMDTNPLAADPKVVLKGQEASFNSGLKVLTRLTDGKVYVCKGPETQISAPDLDQLHFETFAGPHPAGLAGTHIHYLDPVGSEKVVWSVNYQDVIAIGKLFTSGKLSLERVTSLAGPMVRDPKLYRLPLGADLAEFTKGKVKQGEVRTISGSVFAGRNAVGPYAFLGRFHQQVSVIAEGRDRELLGWHGPGFDKFSVKRTFLSWWLTPKKKFDFTTSTGGSVRAMVPIGSYERVMPLDVEPTYLLRALLTADTDGAQQLGALELDEEDLGLLTFACPTKLEYGPHLRNCLTLIERDG
ncbi:Na(+)-translocating NADH-quinone reductase subunit A [Pseudobacteriovorax antillogorgiicola]|uniref:Na(+)-translocating NADH-quinone reductase subunit A n=1 Tax=Pseudobacteriovorax antillogorgiicola TaxID=1513793 RepID=A0A1Y6BHQ1_9BACT|nr:Na(+)-translocating NADH-quinone reductase subunit A [Pseudobacteriovorax antillogorgiicola]TCS55492.1 Na+-transporting NADH:ubiquinone oxidoreductase subunit A [Pseudobacteriovorax antillogorgiicola]SMF11775.1 Na+-transporting NADH:ubiquinone oxidoreductase subunit A [Pseudobacteriovorax antillogorgiicola]